MIKRLTMLGALLALFMSLTAFQAFAQNKSDGERTRSNDRTTSDTAATKRTFTHHTATVNGVRLHYVMGGKGEPVVLLHGWPTTWYEWRRIMPALAERYTVIAPDTRGLGDSSRPINGYDKRTLAEDIYGLVQQLGFKQINLVGHDLGGQIAYAYANEHPENVRRLAILDVPIPGLAGWDEIRNWHFPFHAARDIPEALVEGKERMYITHFYTAFAYNPTAFTKEDIDEYARTYSAPGAMRAGFEYYRAFPEDVRQNREYAKRKLTMPVLALGGASATGTLPLRQLREVATNVRGGVMERCGHWLATECPDRLTQQLLTFFSEKQTRQSLTNSDSTSNLETQQPKDRSRN